MAVTYGFYNSFNGDRSYNTRDISHMFDGIIRDGVFMHVGERFMVRESEGMTVSVGTGRAWFNGTWTYNNAKILLEIEPSAVVLNRIDLVVLEVNETFEARENTIKVIEGVPATNAVAPELIRNDLVNQYPLASIFIGKNVSGLTQANITNMVGSESTPLVTSPLEAMDITDLIAQWNAEWSEWNNTKRTAFLEWMGVQESDFQAWMEVQLSDYTTWSTQRRLEFDEWFEETSAILDDNVAGSLLNYIREVDSQLKSHLAEDATISELGHVKHGVLTTTLDTTWTGTKAPYSKEQTVSGILATDTPIIDIVMTGTLATDEARQENWGLIYRAVTSSNKITFYATEKPTVSLPIQIKVVR